MKVWVTVILDSGGKITVTGEDLTAEDVNEVFGILSGKVVMSSLLGAESIDTPLPGVAKAAK